MHDQRTAADLFRLPRGLSFIALLAALVSLTIFFLIDDVLYYLLFERIFDIRLGLFSKWVVGVVFVFLNFVLAVVVIKAMLRRPQTGVEGMLGAHGEVTESIHPGRTGWVRVQGELWRATADESIAKGKNVEVTGLEGLVLHVRVHQQLSR